LPPPSCQYPISGTSLFHQSLARLLGRNRRHGVPFPGDGRLPHCSSCPIPQPFGIQGRPLCASHSHARMAGGRRDHRAALTFIRFVDRSGMLGLSTLTPRDEWVFRWERNSSQKSRLRSRSRQATPCPRQLNICTNHGIFLERPSGIGRHSHQGMCHA